MKDDFTRIHGHDLVRPIKRGLRYIQQISVSRISVYTDWQGYVYHMTCRGSRFKDGAKRNPDGQVFMKNRESDG